MMTVIDRFGIDAGRSQIGQEWTDRPLARIEHRFAQTGVDDDELCPVLTTIGL